MKAAGPGFCTRCGAARAAATNFCTSCGAASRGGAPVRPAAGDVQTPATAIAVAVVMLCAGGTAAYFSMRDSAEVARAVPGSPSAPRGGAAAPDDGLPSGHPSIELPREVLAFLDSLTADADANPQSVEAAQKLARARYRASVINASYRASAAQALARLLALDPSNMEGLRISANLAYDGGDYAEAEKRFEAYLARTPEDVSAITDLGSAQLFQDRIADAVKSYELALAKDPKFMQALFNMGIALQRQGKTDEAIASLRRALDAADSDQARQQIENTLAEAEGRQPKQFAAAAPRATAAPPGSANTGPAAAPPEPSAQGGMQGGMAMPPPAPDRDVPTTATSDFQRQAEKPLVTHPMIGPRLVAFEWTGATTVRAKIADFPMDRMPPFAREKFRSGMADRIAAIAKNNDVTATVTVELVDAPSGRVMETLTAAATPVAAAVPAAAPAPDAAAVPAPAPAPAATGSSR